MLHPTPTEREIVELLGTDSESYLTELERLLEMIDCPSDFRGLGRVIATLKYSFETQQEEVSKLLGINQVTLIQIFDLFINTHTTNFKEYNNERRGKGWISERPIYTLLFIFYEYMNRKSASSLINFLKHFLLNEAEIIAQNRVEKSVRAFRLLYTDPNIEPKLIKAGSPQTMSNNIVDVRKTIQANDDFSNSSNSLTQIGYLHELEHFYLLDWRDISRTTIDSKRKTRSYFSRTRIERLIGSSDLYTASLNKQIQNDIAESNGLSAYEDYPEPIIVQHEQSTQHKLPHELADISSIKDEVKIQNNQRVINRDVRRSHNLTPLDRTILQPHELHHLWHELNNKGTQAYNGIPRVDIQFVLQLILLTGRELDSVCNLSINTDESENLSGLCIVNHCLTLIVAPEPTSKRIRNKNIKLLATKTVAHITLPPHLFDLFTQCNWQGNHTICGSYNVKNFRKAIESFLKVINKRYLCQVGISRIENYLSNRQVAIEQHDPVLLDIISENVNYYTRSPRHYAWYTDTQLNKGIKNMWLDIFNQITLFNILILCS